MGLPAAEGLSVLYTFIDDWMVRRQMLAALGVEDLDALDKALASSASRQEHLARFMAAAGGDMG